MGMYVLLHPSEVVRAVKNADQVVHQIYHQYLLQLFRKKETSYLNQQQHFQSTQMMKKVQKQHLHHVYNCQVTMTPV